MLRKPLLFLLLALLILPAAYSQSEKTYSVPALGYGMDAVLIPGGGKLMMVLSNNEPMLIRLDGQGTLLWSRIVAAAFSPSRLLCDSTAFYLYTNRNIEKFDLATGNSIWSQAYIHPSNYMNMVRGAIANDGHLIMGGNTSSDPVNSVASALLLKIDKNNGAVIWNKTYNMGGNWDQINGIGIMQDNSIVVNGAYNYFASYDGFVMKLNSSGTFLWGKRVTGSGNTNAGGIITESPNGYLMFLTDVSVQPFFATLTELNKSTGNANWSLRFDAAKDKMIHLGTANYALVGNANYHPTLMRISETGLPEWQQSFSDTLEFNWLNIALTPDQEISIAAYRDSLPTVPGSKLMYRAKFDTLGSNICSTRPDTVLWAVGGPALPNFSPTTGTANISVSQAAPATLSTGNVAENVYCQSCFTQAAFTASDSLFCTGESVSLSDISSGGASRDWQIDGGSFSNQPTASYTFSQPGTFTISLSILDSAGGCPATASKTVTVFALPVPDLGPDTSLCEGDSISLSPGIPGQYLWMPGQQTSPSITVSLAGAYSVQVTDTNGCEASDTIGLSFSPPPTVIFSWTPSQLSVTFNANATGNPSTWAWDFGDGNTSSTQNPSHTYTQAGAYEVCLTVTDNIGCQAEYCDSVVVIGVGLAEATLPPGWQIFPNPFNDKVHIVPNPDSPGLQALFLTSLSGQKIWEMGESLLPAGGLELDWSSLSEGMYFLHFQEIGSEATHVLRLLRQ